MADIKQRTVYLMRRTDKTADDNTDVYIGSTSTSLRERLRKHRDRSKLKKYENTKLYKKMCEVGANNWKITPLFNKTCDEKTIKKLEREYIEKMEANLNTYSPIRTPGERVTYMAVYYERIKQEKKYHCAICEIACCSNRDLQRHLKTSKHFWKYIYSVD